MSALTFVDIPEEYANKKLRGQPFSTAEEALMHSKYQ